MYFGGRTPQSILYQDNALPPPDQVLLDLLEAEGQLDLEKFAGNFSKNGLRAVTAALKSRQKHQELYEATKANSLPLIRRALLSGASPNWSNFDEFHSTTLHVAAGQGYTYALRMLLAAGGSVEIQDDGGFTPLHAAALGGHVEVIGDLLRAGADASVVDKNGQTAEAVAQGLGRCNVVELLLSHAEGKAPAPPACALSDAEL